jgi:hypothetical protein
MYIYVLTVIFESLIMEKRYQVFISSTYEDLKEERNEVVQALLELDCIPCGMEYFPASNETQWDFIKRLIDDCDYYILIVAGRYGSLDNDGFSYTQKEYNYAISKNIPVIAFLHQNPDSLTVAKTDKEQKLKKKLDEFKKEVQSRLCKYWSTPKELGGVVSRSMVQEIKRNPRVGWIKANSIDTNAEKTILGLYKKIEELENIPKANEIKPVGFIHLVENIDELSQGNDEIELKILITEGGYKNKKQRIENVSIVWDKITFLLFPKLTDSIKESVFKSTLTRLIREYLITNNHYKEKINFIIALTDETFETIRIQLFALGYICVFYGQDEKNAYESIVKKIKLTEKGERLLLLQRAKKR